MIAYVRGLVTALAPDHAVLDIGGVGLAVRCAPATLAALRSGESARLSTSMIVREDELTLYGFADDDERGVFELLQSVTGVGPRLAQAVLSVLSPDDLRRAVAADDLVALTRVPGVGRKGAQRLVLELKDRLGPPHGDVPAQQRSAAASAPAVPFWRVQLAAALTGLGWSAREAEVAVDEVSEQAEAIVAEGNEPDPAMLLRQALRSMSKA